MTRGQDNHDMCNSVLQQLENPIPFSPSAIKHLHGNDNRNKTPFGLHDTPFDDVPQGIGVKTNLQPSPNQKDRDDGPSPMDFPIFEEKVVDSFNLSIIAKVGAQVDSPNMHSLMREEIVIK